LSHILVTSLTGVVLMLALVGIYAVAELSRPPATYLAGARTTALPWLYGDPAGERGGVTPGEPPGYVLVVGPDGRVEHAGGAGGERPPCVTGQLLTACAPALAAAAEGQRFVDGGGRPALEVVERTVTGHRVINRRFDFRSRPSLRFPGLTISGWLPMALTLGGAMAVLSVPVALGFALLLARPLGRRLERIAGVSRRFAAGELDARVGDRAPDEVGALARQQDDMAAALQQNLQILRDLAQRNAALVRESETAAVLAERARISRDLHDAIAQRLFSLSASTAALPDLIAADAGKGIERARAVAALAETALLDLRGLLTELRPSDLVARPFAEALEALCREWQADARPVRLSLVLSGVRLPAGVEDVLYRVAQEALANATRHAAARTVHVSVVEGQRRVTLSVTDDGAGFDPAARIGSGFGLVGMRERARSVGGDVWIESEPGRGTTVRAELPFDRDGGPGAAQPGAAQPGAAQPGTPEGAAPRVSAAEGAAQ
jgi:signal transduction histidine kinase